MKLAVNVDHVATLRQARGVAYPDPVEAARIAEAAGALGITVHLRGDRRHVQEADVERLRASVTTRLNLEMAATEEMAEIALRHRPDQVSLVAERPEEVTTEGGLDLGRHRGRVEEVAGRLAAAGIAVSLFLDPDLRQVETASGLPRELVSGFEINTDAYTRAAAAAHPAAPTHGRAAGRAERARERGSRTAAEHALAEDLAGVRRAARLGAEAGLHVYAGHGLTTANVGPIAEIPEIEELNIGHALVSRAVLVGLAEAVREMLRAMGER
ncbi:MAG TPA: pyridoxine 5'-phosphate synthase [Thermoanaerobaculia bacterium]|nr:pyridoxine 5'-phosphate synthase [Thermoanaerobaculia bacterium]